MYKRLLHFLFFPVFCLLFALVPACSGKQVSSKRVTFVVHLKEPARNSKVYLTGNTESLGKWNPTALLMDKQSDSVWTKTVSFEPGESAEFKITAGSWWFEALDSAKQLYGNQRVTPVRDTLTHFTVYDWLHKIVDGKPLLTTRFLNDNPPLKIDGMWRYHPGDNPEWASTTFNDSTWYFGKSFIQSDTNLAKCWGNTGWFRFHFLAASLLWNKSFALTLNQLGAAEIYYNGRLIYSFGKIGTSASTTIPFVMTGWQEIKVDPTYDQVIAVRYANYQWKEHIANGLFAGFVMMLEDLNSAFRSSLEVRKNVIEQMVFTLIPLILCLLHFSLYGYYRKQKQNLFYAMCLLGFAGLTYFAIQIKFVTDSNLIILYTKISNISAVTAILFGVLTLYEIAYGKFPRRWLVFAGIYLFIVGMRLLEFTTGIVGILIYGYFGLTLIEVVIVIFSKKKIRKNGSWILLTGFIIMNISIILHFLVDYQFIQPIFGTTMMYGYGIIALAIAMSLFLSINFASVNRDLEMQLDTVRHLSEQALEHERQSRESEISRRLLESDNARKTAELEDARNVQVAMLPLCRNDIPGYDICFSMRTATEVGGDYYDYLLSADGTFTMVMGDATGHGMKSALMVATIKSLFHSYGQHLSIVDFFTRCTEIIKQMKFGNLFMSLSFLRVRDKNFTVSCAGMPSILIFRQSTGQIEEVLFKSMPLGAHLNFPYQQKEGSLEPGDVLLLVSDGITELFNNKMEMLNRENIKNRFLKNAGLTANEIVAGLFAEADSWRGERPQDDDITIIVVKIKEHH